MHKDESEDVWWVGRLKGRGRFLRIHAPWGGLLLFLGSIVVGLASCANPVAPSGGPRDQTPPSIAKTRPVRDTVNVPTDTRSVYVEFSEYVERSTLPQALSVTPRFEQRIRFDWSGKAVAIELPESLRDSTTYLFSFDTNLSDARGVSLEEPITVAFATGPRINRGQIQGDVLMPGEGTPQARVDVFAYRLSPSATAPPTPLPERPAYRTQTGEDGTFTFEYMREQDYYVVALRDNNRNRRPDPSEPFAVPPRLALSANSSTPRVPVPWLLTKADTLAPRLQRVQPLSQRRLRISFSEPIRIEVQRPDAWALRDSVANARVPVRAVYRSPDRADAVILRTDSMQATRHTVPLTSNLVVDTLGQALVPDTARFQAVTRADTTMTRFQAFWPEGASSDSAGASSLLPDQYPGVRFNQAPDSTVLRRVLSLRDTTGRPRPYSLTTEDGRTYRIRPDSVLQPGQSIEIAVDLRPITGPDTTYLKRYQRVTSRMLGDLEGRAILADTTRGDTATARRRSRPGPTPSPQRDSLEAPQLGTNSPDSALVAWRDSLAQADSVVVELIPTESNSRVDRRTLAAPPESTFVFRTLPKGTFRFRAFLDRNGNGRWDGGRIRPYVPPEPLTWSESTVESRPRWTKVIPAPLRIPILRPERLSDSASPPVGERPDSLSRTTPPVPDTTATDTTGR